MHCNSVKNKRFDTVKETIQMERWNEGQQPLHSLLSVAKGIAIVSFETLKKRALNSTDRELSLSLIEVFRKKIHLSGFLLFIG